MELLDWAPDIAPFLINQLLDSLVEAGLLSMVNIHEYHRVFATSAKRCTQKTVFKEDKTTPSSSGIISRISLEIADDWRKTALLKLNFSEIALKPVLNLGRIIYNSARKINLQTDGESPRWLTKNKTHFTLNLVE